MPDPAGSDDRPTFSPEPDSAPGEAEPAVESALLAIPPAQFAGPADMEPAAPEEEDDDADDPLRGRHVHQIVSVRLGATADSIFVSRTETIVEHTPGSLEEEHGDLWDEHARALGMMRPHPVPQGPLVDGDERRRARSRRPFGRRDAVVRPGGGPFISFGSKSRVPNQMSRTQLEAYLKQERRIALEVRDPIAISYAAERYTTITALLQELPEGEILDLGKPLLTVSQAAKILGYNAKEVRRLLGQGKISGRKVGSEWRIPLRAVL
jgi:excisionase family DNA binding protein